MTATKTAPPESTLDLLGLLSELRVLPEPLTHWPKPAPVDPCELYAWLGQASGKVVLDSSHASSLAAQLTRDYRRRVEDLARNFDEAMTTALRLANEAAREGQSGLYPRPAAGLSNLNFPPSEERGGVILSFIWRTSIPPNHPLATLPDDLYVGVPHAGAGSKRCDALVLGVQNAVPGFFSLDYLRHWRAEHERRQR